MQTYKIAGNIYSAKLTNTEKKALTFEARKIMAETSRQHYNDLDATFMWCLHEVLGFGPKRLHDVYVAFAPMVKDLCDYYEMDENWDESYICKKKLEGLGIDLDKWAEEVKEICKS